MPLPDVTITDNTITINPRARQPLEGLPRGSLRYDFSNISNQDVRAQLMNGLLNDLGYNQPKQPQIKDIVPRIHEVANIQKRQVGYQSAPWSGYNPATPTPVNENPTFKFSIGEGSRINLLRVRLLASSRNRENIEPIYKRGSSIYPEEQQLRETAL